MYISKEIPTGIVNGTNKEFTLQYKPSIVDDLYIDGLTYTKYTINNKQLHLSDAPTQNIYINYFK